MRHLRKPLGDGAALLVASVVALSQVCSANCQSTSYQQAPLAQVYYTNQSTFKLPIKIQPENRAQIKEIILYGRENGSLWKCIHRASPSEESFTYKAPGEGEYWFNVVTIDQNGRANPQDVTRVPPALVVKVDTTPPEVQLFTSSTEEGEVALQCKINDPNPDYKTLELSYKSTDLRWRKLKAVPGSPGVFRLPDSPVVDGAMCYVAQDLAGNRATRMINLAEAMADRPNQGDVKLVAAKHSKQRETSRPDLPLPPAAIVKPLPPTAPTKIRDAKEFDLSTPPLPPAAQAETPVRAASGSTANRHVLRTTRAAIEYRIGDMGPSGISKVDVWCKGENDERWKHIAEDSDCQSPVEVQLSKDGIYEVRLVVTNGNGVGGKKPADMDTGDVVLEIDSQPPTAHLLPMKVGTGNSVEIAWHATDKNLTDQSISLFYATKPGGPWQPIALQIPNSGKYQWMLPKSKSSQYYVRLEVTDIAGNVTRCDSPTPVALDITEPKVFVTGVSSIGAPRGN